MFNLCFLPSNNAWYISVTISLIYITLRSRYTFRTTSKKICNLQFMANSMLPPPGNRSGRVWFFQFRTNQRNLHQNKFIYCCSCVLMSSLIKENSGRKSRDTVPLNAVQSTKYKYIMYLWNWMYIWLCIFKILVTIIMFLWTVVQLFSRHIYTNSTIIYVSLMDSAIIL